MIKIAIIDDSELIRKSIGRLLGTMPTVSIVGYAETVAGAIALIDAEAPEVVILDVNLLDGSRGIEVMHHVKHDYPDTKVIVLTNNIDHSTQDLFLKAGAYAFFDKTMEFMKVIDTVTTMV